MGKDYYKILGVSKNADDNEIRKAYRKAAVRWHPDKNLGDKENSAKMFKDLAEAYEVLSDKQKRSIYNQYGEEGLKTGFVPPGDDGQFRGGKMPAGFTFTSSGGGFNPRNAEDIFSQFFSGLKRSRPASSAGDGGAADSDEDIPMNGSARVFGLEGLFGSMGGLDGTFGAREDSASDMGTRSRPFSDSSSPPSKSPPSTHELVFTLEELFSGTSRKVRVNRHRIDGSGHRKNDSKIVQVNVVPGWKAGTKVTFEGDGDEKPGHTPGDVVFVISEKKHDCFTREGNDLVFVHRLDLKDALTASTIEVPTLDRTAVLHVDVSQDAISPDYVKRVKGAGMPVSKRPGERGDMLVRFDIRFPSQKLTPSQQKSIASALP